MSIGFLVGDVNRSETNYVILTSGPMQREVLYNRSARIDDKNVALQTALTALKDHPEAVVEVVTVELVSTVKAVEVVRLRPMITDDVSQQSENGN